MSKMDITDFKIIVSAGLYSILGALGKNCFSCLFQVLEIA